MAVLLTGTTIGGHGAIHAGNMADHGIITTSNIGSYALTGVPSNVITTSGGQTIGGTTYFSGGESLNLYGIRGRFTNEYIHLYNKVGIGHPSGWGQGEGNTPGYGLSTYGGATIAYGNSAGMNVYGSITTDTYVYTNYSVRVGEIWGQGGLYRSSGHMMFGTEGGNWYFQSQNNTRAYFASGDGNLWMQWGGWLSDLLSAKQNSSTAITTSNIGSQSVASASQVSGVSVSATEMNRLKTTLGATGLPYSCDIYVEGDPNTYYPVHFIWGDQDIWRRIIIKRGYSEQAPWDPIGTGVHHGGLLIDWEGNFGGWGGAEYSDRLRVFQESYTTICADMYRTTHSMGYTFFLRGGGAVYHIYSDQNIRGYHQDGVPDIAYDTNFKFYDSATEAHIVYAPAPLTTINSSRIDGLRTKKQSQFDGRYQQSGTAINTGNIGSQSVNYAASAGNADTVGGYSPIIAYGSNDVRGRVLVADPGSGNISTHNPELYSGEVRLGAAWDRGGVYAEGVLSLSTSSSQIDFVFGDTIGATVAADGNIYMSWAGSWLSTLLDAKQNASTAINTDNIGSQSVSYATDSGNSNTTSQIAFTDLKGNFPSGSGGGHSFAPNHYSMGLDVGNGGWDHPHYRDLIIGYHTGVRIGANYSGIRFYNNSPTTDANNDGNGDGEEALLMTIGGYVGTASQTDVVVNNNLFANGSMRAPIFYDSDNTNYYLNPAGGSRLRNLYVGDSGDDWSDPGSWGTQVRFSNEPHVKFVLHARTPGIEAGMYVHTPGSVFMGSYTAHVLSLMYAGNMRMQVEDSRIYSNVYMESASSMRAPIFYDSADTGYYLDPNGTSNLLKLSDRTMGFNGMNPMSANSPYEPRYNASVNYRTGSMGYGTVGLNAIGSNWGSGFIDSWSSPAEQPNSSTSHWVGLQSIHYGHQDSTNFYGFQMVSGADTNRFYLRAAWPTPLSWVEVITSDNIGSQSVSNADTVDGLHASSFFRADAANSADARIEAGDGRGLKFWDSDSYKIYMSDVNNGTWGGRVGGETTSDYNMYFRMSGGTNRGFVFRNNTDNVASIDASGNGRFEGDVVAYSASDKRLKNNLTPIENACEKVQKLTGYEFDWNNNQDVYKGHDIGVVAQEVEEVFPDIVKTRDTGYKAVDYEKLVAVLIEANKELQNRVQTLEDRIDGLTK